MSTLELARYVIGLSWIYHGFMPKLLQIAPLEQKMTSSLGFSAEATYLLIKAVGAGEVLFGVIFICCYSNKVIQLVNIVALVSLLLFAVILTPFILLEAFNPVTTNIPLIVLAIYLYQQVQMPKAKNTE